MKRVVVGITGASGSIYGVRIVKALLEGLCRVDLIITKAGMAVLREEVPASTYEWLLEPRQNLALHPNENLFSDIASGSAMFHALVIAPCSMDTISAIATGRSENLVERVADVAIKERRQLLVIPRETPLSTIHLRNMFTIAEAGVTVLPAMPAFYHKPNRVEDLIDFIAGKTLNLLGVPQDILKPWNS